MIWILSTIFGLAIAIGCYLTIGALVNLIIGPVLGYKIMVCSIWGFGVIDQDGIKKLCKTKFTVTPEVLLHVNKEEKVWKKLILESVPVLAGFAVCMLFSVLFGGVGGFQRHILISFLSAMAVIYCWHIFIFLKMIVYVQNKK
nr:hypothetical protein [Lachnospiraceae bacterium]MBQ8253845.1 hypothetical protein [Lachnospiraceae bacterium]